jgi:hypothetical protein
VPVLRCCPTAVFGTCCLGLVLGHGERIERLRQSAIGRPVHARSCAMALLALPETSTLFYGRSASSSWNTGHLARRVPLCLAGHRGIVKPDSSYFISIILAGIIFKFLSICQVQTPSPAAAPTAVASVYRSYRIRCYAHSRRARHPMRSSL